MAWTRIIYILVLLSCHGQDKSSFGKIWRVPTPCLGHFVEIFGFINVVASIWDSFYIEFASDSVFLLWYLGFISYPVHYVVVGLNDKCRGFMGVVYQLSLLILCYSDLPLLGETMYWCKLWMLLSFIFMESMVSIMGLDSVCMNSRCVPSG